MVTSYYRSSRLCQKVTVLTVFTQQPTAIRQNQPSHLVSIVGLIVRGQGWACTEEVGNSIGAGRYHTALYHHLALGAIRVGTNPSSANSSLSLPPLLPRVFCWQAYELSSATKLGATSSVWVTDQQWSAMMGDYFPFLPFALPLQLPLCNCYIKQPLLPLCWLGQSSG